MLVIKKGLTRLNTGLSSPLFQDQRGVLGSLPDLSSFRLKFGLRFSQRSRQVAFSGALLFYPFDSIFSQNPIRPFRKTAITPDKNEMLFPRNVLCIALKELYQNLPSNSKN